MLFGRKENLGSKSVRSTEAWLSGIDLKVLLDFSVPARFSKYPIQPVKEARRKVADCLIAANAYVLGA